MNFSNLLQKKSNMASLVKATETKQQFQKQEKDPRFWTCSYDPATESGYGIIRFLYLKSWWDSGGDNVEIPWVSWYEHSFMGYNKRMYIERSLSSLGEEDPLFNLNKKLWDTGEKRWQDYVSKNTKRKIAYVAQILVVEDPANPENNGKVKLLKFGSQIFKKLEKAMKPTIKVKKAIDPFSIGSDGANFNLILSRKDGSEYRSYEESDFDSMGALYGGDSEKLMGVYSQLYSSLDEFIARDKFSTFDELKKKLDWVLNCDSENFLETTEKKTPTLTNSIGGGTNSTIPVDVTPKVSGPKPTIEDVALQQHQYKEVEPDEDDEEDDEKIAFFKSLL